MAIAFGSLKTDQAAQSRRSCRTSFEFGFATVSAAGVVVMCAQRMSRLKAENLVLRHHS